MPDDTPSQSEASVPEPIALLASVLARLSASAPARGVEPEGLGPNDAAAYLGVSVSKLHDLNSRGFVPAPIEIGDGGRCGRWSRSELKAWLLAGAPGRVRWAMMRDAALKRVG